MLMKNEEQLIRVLEEGDEKALIINCKQQSIQEFAPSIGTGMLDSTICDIYLVDDAGSLPLLKQFAETAEYYSTAFHELTHSPGHKSRLDRLERTAFFGSEAYSKEELIAEIGAAALVNHVGLETSASFRNSAAYLQNWLQVLKNDKRFIVSAAGKAEKAVELILGAAG